MPSPPTSKTKHILCAAQHTCVRSRGRVSGNQTWVMRSLSPRMRGSSGSTSLRSTTGAPLGIIGDSNPTTSVRREGRKDGAR
eukprot:2024210-Rhodomonas_salina.2